MKPELDQILTKDFPNLYRDRYGDMRNTCMCWGFPGDGWFGLLYELSAKLEKLILELPEEERSMCRAAQVKEKYGTLRFYMTTHVAGMEALIGEAEQKSAETCEVCGKPGETAGPGWFRTLCPECRK